ncbi:hypothetical protein PoB_004082800 [Plakobranchus ocellatus]|uniref:Very large A-kinase anchor protein n=1 Tax=Plakobranchus ocellatus TaxID=259542 RepID=A0AAV4B6B5_9GAST|nr:hypothetical protein PoB_004082800 [Plakobranchus ocellatus]
MEPNSITATNLEANIEKQRSPYLRERALGSESPPDVGRPLVPPEDLDRVDGIRPSNSRTRAVVFLPAIEESVEECPDSPHLDGAAQQGKHVGRRTGSKPTLTSISEEKIPRVWEYPPGSSRWKLTESSGRTLGAGEALPSQQGEDEGSPSILEKASDGETGLAEAGDADAKEGNRSNHAVEEPGAGTSKPSGGGVESVIICNESTSQGSSGGVGASQGVVESDAFTSDGLSNKPHSLNRACYDVLTSLGDSEDHVNAGAFSEIKNLEDESGKQISQEMCETHGLVDKIKENSVFNLLSYSGLENQDLPPAGDIEACDSEASGNKDITATAEFGSRDVKLPQMSRKAIANDNSGDVVTLLHIPMEEFKGNDAWKRQMKKDDEKLDIVKEPTNDEKRLKESKCLARVEKMDTMENENSVDVIRTSVTVEKRANFLDNMTFEEKELTSSGDSKLSKDGYLAQGFSYESKGAEHTIDMDAYREKDHLPMIGERNHLPIGDVVGDTLKAFENIDKSLKMLEECLRDDKKHDTSDKHVEIFEATSSSQTLLLCGKTASLMPPKHDEDEETSHLEDVGEVSEQKLVNSDSVARKEQKNMLTKQVEYFNISEDNSELSFHIDETNPPIISITKNNKVTLYENLLDKPEIRNEYVEDYEVCHLDENLTNAEVNINTFNEKNVGENNTECVNEMVSFKNSVNKDKKLVSPVSNGPENISKGKEMTESLDLKDKTDRAAETKDRNMEVLVARNNIAKSGDDASEIKSISTVEEDATSKVDGGEKPDEEVKISNSSQKVHNECKVPFPEQPSSESDQTDSVCEPEDEHHVLLITDDELINSDLRDRVERIDTAQAQKRIEMLGRDTAATLFPQVGDKVVSTVHRLGIFQNTDNVVKDSKDQDLSSGQEEERTASLVTSSVLCIGEEQVMSEAVVKEITSHEDLIISSSGSSRPKGSGSDSVVAEGTISSVDMSGARESVSDHTSCSDKADQTTKAKDGSAKTRGRERDRGKRKRADRDDRDEHATSPSGKQKSLKNAVGDVQAEAEEQLEAVTEETLLISEVKTQAQDLSGRESRGIRATNSGDIRENAPKSTCGLESQTVTSLEDSPPDNFESASFLDQEQVWEDSDTGHSPHTPPKGIPSSRFGKRTQLHRQKQSYHEEASALAEREMSNIQHETLGLGDSVSTLIEKTGNPKSALCKNSDWGPTDDGIAAVQDESYNNPAGTSPKAENSDSHAALVRVVSEENNVITCCYSEEQTFGQAAQTETCSAQNAPFKTAKQGEEICLDNAILGSPNLETADVEGYSFSYKFDSEDKMGVDCMSETRLEVKQESPPRQESLSSTDNRMTLSCAQDHDSEQMNVETSDMLNIPENEEIKTTCDKVFKQHKKEDFDHDGNNITGGTLGNENVVYPCQNRTGDNSECPTDREQVCCQEIPNSATSSMPLIYIKKNTGGNYVTSGKSDSGHFDGIPTRAYPETMCFRQSGPLIVSEADEALAKTPDYESQVDLMPFDAINTADTLETENSFYRTKPCETSSKEDTLGDNLLISDLHVTYLVKELDSSNPYQAQLEQVQEGAQLGPGLDLEVQTSGIWGVSCPDNETCEEPKIIQFYRGQESKTGECFLNASVKTMQAGDPQFCEVFEEIKTKEAYCGGEFEDFENGEKLPNTKAINKGNILEAEKTLEDKESWENVGENNIKEGLNIPYASVFGDDLEKALVNALAEAAEDCSHLWADNQSPHGCLPPECVSGTTKSPRSPLLVSDNQTLSQSLTIASVDQTLRSGTQNDENNIFTERHFDEEPKELEPALPPSSPTNTTEASNLETNDILYSSDVQKDSARASCEVIMSFSNPDGNAEMDKVIQARFENEVEHRNLELKLMDTTADRLYEFRQSEFHETFDKAVHDSLTRQESSSIPCSQREESQRVLSKATDKPEETVCYDEKQNEEMVFIGQALTHKSPENQDILERGLVQNDFFIDDFSKEKYEDLNLDYDPERGEEDLRIDCKMITVLQQNVSPILSQRRPLTPVAGDGDWGEKGDIDIRFKPAFTGYVCEEEKIGGDQKRIEDTVYKPTEISCMIPPGEQIIKIKDSTLIAAELNDELPKSNCDEFSAFKRNDKTVESPAQTIKSSTPTAMSIPDAEKPTSGQAVESKISAEEECLSALYDYKNGVETMESTREVRENLQETVGKTNFTNTCGELVDKKQKDTSWAETVIGEITKVCGTNSVEQKLHHMQINEHGDTATDKMLKKTPEQVTFSEPTVHLSNSDVTEADALRTSLISSKDGGQRVKRSKPLQTQRSRVCDGRKAPADGPVKKITVVDVELFPDDVPCVYHPDRESVRTPPKRPPKSSTSSKETKTHRKRSTLWRRLKTILHPRKRERREELGPQSNENNSLPVERSDVKLLQPPVLYLRQPAKSDFTLDVTHEIKPDRAPPHQSSQILPVTHHKVKARQLQQWRRLKKLRALRHGPEKRGARLPITMRQVVSKKNYVREAEGDSSTYERQEGGKNSGLLSQRQFSPDLLVLDHHCTHKQNELLSRSTPEVPQVFRENEDITDRHLNPGQPTVRLLLKSNPKVSHSIGLESTSTRGVKDPLLSLEKKSKQRKAEKAQKGATNPPCSGRDQGHLHQVKRKLVNDGDGAYKNPTLYQQAGATVKAPLMGWRKANTFNGKDGDRRGSSYSWGKGRANTYEVKTTSFQPDSSDQDILANGSRVTKSCRLM